MVCQSSTGAEQCWPGVTGCLGNTTGFVGVMRPRPFHRPERFASVSGPLGAKLVDCIPQRRPFDKRLQAAFRLIKATWVRDMGLDGAVNAVLHDGQVDVA